MEYAGLGRRFAALAVDFLIFCVVFFPVTRIVKGTWIMTASDHMWGYGAVVTDPICLAFLAIMFLYFVLLEGLSGGTLGKRALRLRVVDIDGGGIDLRRAFLRNILRIVDGLPMLSILGIVLIATSPERARFGDRMAGTRVIVAA
jgi:uncharacterized RDD family membrane protein YckC